MVTIWNFDLTTIYLTAWLATGIILYDRRRFRRLFRGIIGHFDSYFDQRTLRYEINQVLISILPSQKWNARLFSVWPASTFMLGLLILSYILISDSANQLIYGIAAVVGFLPITVLFSQISQESPPQTKTKPGTELERKERIIELEERLHTAELTLAYANRSLKEAQDKCRHETNRRKRVENKLVVLEKSEGRLSKLNENLNQQVRALKKESFTAQNELEEFSYSISHDLRAPMRLIGGFSEILIEDHGQQLDQEGLDTIETIQSNALKMSEMLNQILSFSSIARKSIDKSEIETNALVSEILKEISETYRIESNGIQVSDNLPMIPGDRPLIKQAFMSIIDNAVKYAKDEKLISIKIGYKNHPTQDLVSFFVQDEGIGFDMKFHNNIFKAFKRLHKSSEMKGQGMGLTLAKKITNKHGGQIWAESEVGKGSIFYLSLPLADRVSEPASLPYTKSIMVETEL